MENEQKKATPGKIALAVGVVVVLAAVLVAVVMGGMAPAAVEEPVETAPAVTEATIPADGNPNDETAKGSYTASDAEVLAARETVVATLDGKTLTNGQLQVFYWMEVQNFLSSYGSYAPYFGLDYTKPLDTQICGMTETGCTWQQFFLAGAVNTWRNYQSLTAEAEKAGYQLDAQMQAELDSTAEMMQRNAEMYGFATAEELLAENVGPGATMEDYLHFLELYYTGTLYFDSLVEAQLPSDEEVEAYFTQHEQSYAENGVTRDTKVVNVRHLLIMPDGADSSNIRTETFDDAAWASAKTKAEELLAQFESGDKSEQSFSQLAMEHSQDGSAANGGLYTDVAEGQMVENFENWCFDSSRVSGDYGMVETEFGYHLMYFVSERAVWMDQVRSEMESNLARDTLNEILAACTVDAEFEKMLIGYLNMGGEAPAQEPAAQTPVQQKSEWKDEYKPLLGIIAASVAILAAAAYVLREKEF